MGRGYGQQRGKKGSYRHGEPILGGEVSGVELKVSR